jgi:hypothetical protein
MCCAARRNCGSALRLARIEEFHVTDRDADLEALFAEPAQLPDSKPLLREILLEIDRQRRRRSFLLSVAAFAGALPLLLLAVAAWPVIAPLLDSFAISTNAVLGRQITLSLPQIPQAHAQYGVWIWAAAGLLATGVAALRSLRAR